jgi:Terpene synthase family 2, C-terminal metal binding
MSSLPYRVPPLYWPVPPDPHPRSQELARRVEESLAADGVFTVPRYRHAFDELGLAALVCGCHPSGDFEGVVLATVIEAWTFLCDDPQGEQWFPAVLVPDFGALDAGALLARALDPEVQKTITDPLERSMAHSLRKLAAYTSHEKVRAYAQAIIGWIIAEMEDMQLRAGGTPPSVNDAVRARLITAGVPVVRGYTAPIFPRLTPEEANDPDVRAIWDLQALAIACHNDLYSGYLDFDTGSTLMHAYMHEQNASPQEAADFIARLADRATHESLRRAAKLAKSSPPWVNAYVNTVFAYTTTGLNWYPSVIGTRYQAPGMDMGEVEFRRSPEPAATGRPDIASIDHLWT